MEFIQKRASLFNKLVVNYFIRNYNLTVIKTLSKLNIRNQKLIYVNNSHVIIHNKVINNHYNLHLDETKYTLVMILYKNIKYKQKGQNAIATLNSETKKSIYKVFRNIKQNKINKRRLELPIGLDIMIIGRKYKNEKAEKAEVVNNSLGLYCIANGNIPFKLKPLNTQVPLALSCQINKVTNLRRSFLTNLKSVINDNTNGYFIDTLYINNIIKNSLFLDVEFTNDIYDDFSTFPIAQDNSLLFMIGMVYIDGGKSFYKDLTTKRLTVKEEYRILQDFVNYIDKDFLIIFHWSPADKYIIEKSLSKYPSLNKKYKSKKIIYVDLLVVLKKTIKLQSYSLKYVAQELLKIYYDTNCQNGLDAMCSIIQNDISLQNSNKDLLSLSSSKDIVKYNKIDTTLLYKIVKRFTL